MVAFIVHPPLERKHRLAIVLMVVAGILAALLFCAAIETYQQSCARDWQARQQQRQHR